MTRVILPSKHPSETKKVTFDFISQLGASETILTAAVTASVWSGVDATPSAIVNGAASISGTQAIQSIKDGVAGVVYKLTCTITTSASQTLTLLGYLAVVGDPL